MGRIHIFAVIILGIVSGSAGAQSPGNPPGTVPNQGTPASAANQSMAASSVIKVLSPKVHEKLGASGVTLRFQVDNPGAAADTSPTYRVQLDARDPVEITSTEHSFTGLADGEHVITIELVDANHTPIPQSRTEVRFRTYTPGAGGSVSDGRASSASAPPVVKAKWELPRIEGHRHLPSAATELPLLSMVGFGVLVGGIISAMRTRR